MFLRLTLVANTDPVAFSFDLFVHTCDVAGALGHVNNTLRLCIRNPLTEPCKP